MRKTLRMICLVTVLCLLLTGCQLDFRGYFQGLAGMVGIQNESAAQEMTYTRPDMANARTVLESSCDAAINGETVQQVLNGIYAYYDVYNGFYTNYNLAYIRYCQDVTDSYWEGEYTYCMENAAQIDAGLEELFYTLADSPWRDRLEGRQYFGEGYFDAYDGESIWDEAFLSLLEGEARLLNEYYTVFEESLNAEPYSDRFFLIYGTRMEDIFVRLIAQRQKIAAYAGYDSYPEFAYDYYFLRDYTPQQTLTYLETLPERLEPLYTQVNQSDVFDDYSAFCSAEQTLAYGSSAAKAMGGKIAEAFDFMTEKNVYDISYSKNKYDISFELYLYGYQTPFLFMKPAQDVGDKLTFVHEFGHFVNDYVCSGSGVGTDVAEVHSQAMEYLSLEYADGGDALTKLKLVGSLFIYVEQSAYALFEHQVYGLRDEDLTVENVRALYESIGLRFGFDSWAWDCRDYVNIGHFFTNPMYIISYVTSNDLALQIYQKELAQKGEGLRLYNACLEAQDALILSFAETHGLESPFAEGRIDQVCKTLEDALK